MSTSNAPVAIAQSAPRGLRLNVETAVASLLICVHVLLPLDLGMPGINIGKTLSPSIVASLLTLLILGRTSRGVVFAGFKRRFAVGISLFVFIMIGASSHSWNPFNSFSHTLRFYGCFVVNYVIFIYLVERYGYKWMTKAVLIGGSLAALVAIGEVATGSRLPLYQHFIEAATESGEGMDMKQFGFDFFRASGTMGNPIFMSILMTVCVPYVFDVRSSTLRIVLLALLAGGAAATVSRTAGIGIFVFTIGCALIYKRKFWIIAGSTALALGVLGVSSLGSKVDDNPYVMVWATRLGLSTEAGTDRADENVTLRAENSARVLKELSDNSNPLELLLGHGYLSTMLIAKLPDGSPGTLDDTPATILFEEGVVGFIVFYGVFAMAAWDSRKLATKTLHWYNGIALVASGLGTNFETYSMFNIVAVGSIAIVTARQLGAAKQDPIPDPNVEALENTESGDI